MSGQKKSDAPLWPVIFDSFHAASAKTATPIVMRIRASYRLVSRPTTAMETAVASAPGNRMMSKTNGTSR